MLRLAVVVPTYNEVNNVQTLIAAIADVSKLHADTDITVVIVDDSSPDGTAELANQLAQSVASANYRVRTIVKPVKEGLGAAYIYGFTRLRGEGFDYFLQMDADLSHDPRYISGFIHQAKAGTEVVVASRYIPGGGAPDWTWNRLFLSRGGNLYARLILSRRISDWTGGFNLYSAALLERIRPETISATGYGFQLVLKYRALTHCTSLAELPIVFMDRAHGSSKLPRNTLVKNLLLVLRIKLRQGE
ncbi:MAG: polyprenol monophosphomannose synthase [Lacisediminihabitans sp.]